MPIGTSDGLHFEDAIAAALNRPTPIADRPKPKYPDNTGLLEKGNINLANRPVVRNEDGSISTLRSMSFGMSEVGKDEYHVLIPTIHDSGKIMSEKEAIDQYFKTSKHLGKFDSSETATSYAKQLHEDQEKMYVNPD